MKVRSTNSSQLLFKILVYGVVALIGLSIIYPYVYAISVALRPPKYLFQAKQVIWIPPVLTTKHIEAALALVGDELINSALVGIGTAILSLLITIPTSYIFGRKEFPGKRFFFYAVIVALMSPYILLVVPITVMWRDIGLYNTLPGLWLSYQVFVTPFAIWILQDFFASLPENLEEAARVYGATEFGAFVRVILPLAAPAVVAVGFLSFLTGWNDFLFSNMLTTSQGPRTATVVIYTRIVGTELPRWNTTIAAALIIGTPPMVLYMISRHYLANAFAST